MVGGEDGGEIFCGIDLDILPEGCIAAVVSFTCPRDACRFTSVSKIFKSAADSDAVWEQFLPSDYREILARSDGGVSLLDLLSRKELFMHLADNPILIDDGAMRFSLEKSTGKKCCTIGAKNLDITWGDTPRYWTWHSMPRSRFSEVAELVRVCWLEIKGKVKAAMLSPDTDYCAYFVFTMAAGGAYGFHGPAEVVVKTAGGKAETGNVYLESRDRHQVVLTRRGVPSQLRAPVVWMQPTEREDDSKLPKPRPDGWSEVKIGEFSAPRDEDGEVELSLLEVKCGNWKSGLVVEGIEIRPKIAKD